MKNQFLQHVYSHDAYTENGALSHSTSGSALVNYFAHCGSHRHRDLAAVFADMSAIWAESPYLALQVIFYNRLITRKTKGFVNTARVQKGQGNRSEFRKCLIWLSRYQKLTLYNNLWLVPVIGSWKDLWHIELLPELNHKEIYELINLGLTDDYQRDLLAKYLPKIRSKSNTFNKRHEQLNAFAYGLLKYLKWTPKQYRKFKSSGQAHVFQRKMCANKWASLNFKAIPGKALFNLVNSVGKDGKTSLQRHHVEQAYLKWIKSQPVSKFTGYVHELMQVVKPNMTLAQKLTVDKQFEGLIELAKSDEQRISENVWCALDTSGSMQAKVANTSAFNICISLGIYFSSLNEGAFKNHVVMFDSKSSLLQLYGTFSEKVLQIAKAQTAWGSTNFQSVIDQIVRIRKKRPNIPISEFPTSLLVVSDMQFNPVKGNSVTNYQRAMQKLAAVGLPPIKIIWWWVTGRRQTFPNKAHDQSLIMIGGFDGAIISLLLGKAPPTTTDNLTPAVAESISPYKAMLIALNQAVLHEVKL